MPDFSSNAHLGISAGGGGESNGPEVDYSLALGWNLSIGGGMGHRQGPSPGINPLATHPTCFYLNIYVN